MSNGSVVEPGRPSGDHASVLPDGTYDVIVVDAEGAGDDRIRIELAIVAGDHKGEMVALQSPGGSDTTDLFGIPGTLTITEGSPQLRLEP